MLVAFARSDHRAASEWRGVGANADRRAPGHVQEEAALHSLPLLLPQRSRGSGAVSDVPGGSAEDVLQGKQRRNQKKKIYIYIY